MALTAADKEFLLTLKNQGVSKEEAISRLVEVKKGLLKEQSPTVSAVSEQIGKALPGATAIQGIEEKVPFVGGMIKEAIPQAKEIQKEEQFQEKVEDVRKGMTGELPEGTVGVTGEFGLDVATPIKKGVEATSERSEERQKVISAMPETTIKDKALKAQAQFNSVGIDALGYIGMPVFKLGEEIGTEIMEAPFLPGGLAQTAEEIQNEGVKIFASPQEILESYIDRAPEGVKEFIGEEVRDKVAKFNTFYDSLDPIQQQNLKDTGFLFQSVMGILGTGMASKGVKPLIKGVDDLIEAVPAPKPKALPELKIPKTKKEVTPLQEMFTSVGTKKAKDQAFKEGRVVVGDKSTLMGDKADFILPSVKEVKVAQTVEDIFGKDFSKLDISTAHTKMGDEIVNIAVKLQPELAKIKAGKDAVKTLSSKLDDLVQIQNADALASSSAYKGILDKSQSNFKEIVDSLVKKSNDNTLTVDDIWMARKNYDKLIKDRVKTATDSSDPSYIIQKDVWLENRSLLNELIEEEAKNLSGDVQKAFSDMNSLYNGQAILETNFKYQAKDKPGVIGKMLGGVVTKKGAAIAGGSLALGYALGR